jgi:putative transposase
MACGCITGSASVTARMQGFKSAGRAQRFLAAYGPIAHHFRLRRHLFPAPKYRQEMGNRCHTRHEITAFPTAA